MIRSIEASLAKRGWDKKKTPLDQQRVNNLLIAAYTDRPLTQQITRARFDRQLETRWLAGVRAKMIAGEHLAAALQQMIDRESN